MELPFTMTRPLVRLHHMSPTVQFSPVAGPVEDMPASFGYFCSLLVARGSRACRPTTSTASAETLDLAGIPNVPKDSILRQLLLLLLYQGHLR